MHSVRHAWVLPLSSILVLAACGGASSAVDASLDARGAPGDALAFDAAPPDAAPPDAMAGAVTTYQVPVGGGSVDVHGSQVYRVAFPADVAGRTFTIEVLAATSFGFAAGRFLDLLRFGPNGTQLTTPVTVRPANPAATAPIALLYPEPVVPAGAEVAFAAGGAFPVAHFSVLAVPGGKSSVCNGELSETSYGDGTNCLTFVLQGANGYNPNGMMSVVGQSDVGDDCFMLDNCMRLMDEACVDPATVADVKAGAWAPATGSSNLSFVEVRWEPCPAFQLPLECRVGNAGGNLTAAGCDFAGSCSGMPLGLTCAAGTCKCTGGNATSFPQGATCGSAINGLTAMYARCR